MPTLVLCTGFEHGISNDLSWIKGNTGLRYADAKTGPGAIVSTTPRTGGFCFEVAATAATEGIAWNTSSLGTGNTLVASFGIYFPSLPAADVRVGGFITSNSTFDLSIWFRNSDDKLLINNSNATGTAAVGPVVTTGQWYWLDLRMTTAGTLWTVDWQVDGTTQTTFTHTTTTDTVTGIELGSQSTAVTMTVRYDDLVASRTSADYPLGEHAVQLLTADTGGTTAEIGTPNATSRFVTNSTADATHNSAQILAALTDGPPPTLGASASGVAQRTTSTTSAAGIPMTTYTLSAGETISGMRIEIPGWAATTTAATLGFRTFNGTTETILQAGTVDPNFDADTTTPGWFCMMATAADFDTQAEVDAFVLRIGYSSDASPVLGAHAIYAALAVKESTAAATSLPIVVMSPPRSL